VSEKLAQDARGLPKAERHRIDCEKDDYVRFLGLLKLSPGAVVVADNILSHDLSEYVAAVRAYPGVESVTLPIGKGLEVSRFVSGSPGRA
jgi:predicted O-methyltransferase YrrM